MDIKSLMIGDWVMMKPFPNSEPFPNQIVGIEYNSWEGADYCDWVNCKEWGELSLNEIEPIPLTKEILEKNGFIRYGTSYILKESMFELTNPSNPDRYLDNYYIRLARQNKRVMYVHKLQHFMREFGIEKEIEL